MPLKKPTQPQNDGQQGDDRTSENINKRARDNTPGEPIEHVEVFLERLSSHPAWLGTPEAQRQISEFARHLATCEHCQVTLEALLRELTKRADPQSARASTGEHLIERLRAVVERSRARKELSAYALKWCALGEEAARATFPATAAHLETCARCRAEVMHRLESLREQMSTLLMPRLGVARPMEAANGPAGDAALRAGVERLAWTPIQLRDARHIAAPTLIVSLGAEAGEVSATLGHAILAMSAEDRQRVALISIEDGEQTFSWRSLRRAQNERQPSEQGPWLAEVSLGEHSSTSVGLAPRARQQLAGVLDKALRALPLVDAGEPLRVLLVTPLAEAARARHTIEMTDMLRDMTRRQGRAVRVTVLPLPAGDGARAAGQRRPLGPLATRGAATAQPGQPSLSATSADLLDAVWLVDLDDVPPEEYAEALSRQVRAWLAGGAEASALASMPPRARSAGEGRHTLPVYASRAAEIVFPLEEIALAFALRTAATMLPALAEREGLPQSAAWAPQAQLSALAEERVARWRAWVSRASGVHDLLDHRGTPGITSALERLYTWATLRASDAKPAARADEDLIITTHFDDCRDSLAVARRNATRAPVQGDVYGETDEEVARWLALSLVGYYHWFYGEKLGALDLCELLQRAGQATSVEACAALLARQAEELQRRLEAATPPLPTADTSYNYGPAPANRLVLALRGQRDIAWGAMADALRAALERAAGPSMVVALDPALPDPHRLRLWFTRPVVDLAALADPLGWLALVSGVSERQIDEWRQAMTALPNSGGLIKPGEQPAGGPRRPFPQGQPQRPPRKRMEEQRPQRPTPPLL